MNPSCFANHYGACIALKPFEAYCRGCAFFKTTEQVEAERERAWSDIAAKPKYQQEYIADRYYHGKMPWKEAGRHDR